MKRRKLVEPSLGVIRFLLVCWIVSILASCTAAYRRQKAYIALTPTEFCGWPPKIISDTISHKPFVWLSCFYQDNNGVLRPRSYYLPVYFNKGDQSYDASQIPSKRSQ